jgi:hypothetical protein
MSGEKFIHPGVEDPIELFSRMATLGTSGSGSERGMGGAYLALEPLRDTANAGFFRDDAAIHTIVISDEPDHTPASLVTQDEFVDWYESLKPVPADRTFSSIVDPQIGATYASLTRQLGGVFWDLADGDWPGLLDRLGVQAAGLKTEYFLSQIPNPDTIVVQVVTEDGAAQGPFEEGTEWFYESERNSVSFVEFVPDELSHVIVTYEAISTGVVVGDTL